MIKIRLHLKASSPEGGIVRKRGTCFLEDSALCLKHLVVSSLVSLASLQMPNEFPSVIFCNSFIKGPIVIVNEVDHSGVDLR